MVCKRAQKRGNYSPLVLAPVLCVAGLIFSLSLRSLTQLVNISILYILRVYNYIVYTSPSDYFGLNGFLATAKTLCTCDMFTQ